MRAVFLVASRVGFLVLIRAVFRGPGRAGFPAAIRAVASQPAGGLVPGLTFARELILAGGHRATVRRPASRSPPRLARRPPGIPRARRAPVTPIRVSAPGPAPEPGRIPVPGQAVAGLDREQIPGPDAARRPGSAHAPMPGSGRGRGRTARPRRGPGRASTAGHDRMPHAALTRPCHPVRPRPHGLPERNGRPVNLVSARRNVPRGGTAAAGCPALPVSHGRATGEPSRVPTHCRPAQTRPCPGRPPVPGAVAATVPAPARTRGARRKCWRGETVHEAAADGAAVPSSRPHRTVRLHWAAMSCWAAMRRRAGTRWPTGAWRHRAVTSPQTRTGSRAVAHCVAGTRRLAATGPTAARAGPPTDDALRGGARRPPDRRTLRHCRVTSGSRTKPGTAAEGPAAVPRIGTLPLTRPSRTTGPAAVPGPPGPVPEAAGAGSVPCCLPCWRSWSSRPGRWPR